MNSLFALAALTAASAAAPAFAAAPDAPSPALDSTQFCYYAGQPYSEGAGHAGQRCARDYSGDAFQRNKIPLRWEPIPSVRKISDAGEVKQ